MTVARMLFKMVCQLHSTVINYCSFSYIIASTSVFLNVAEKWLSEFASLVCGNLVLLYFAFELEIFMLANLFLCMAFVSRLNKVLKIGSFSLIF